MNPLVIGVNPNENTMREPNPNVPWTPGEIAADVAACARAGATVAHVHARTAAGAPDHTAAAYSAIAALVRERCDVLLAPSLANGPGFDVEQRLAPVLDPVARPEFLTMDMGCAVMDFWDPRERRFRTDGRIVVNDTATHRRLFACARELGLTPWMASFTVGWTRTAAAHLDAGEVRGRAVLQFVLGGPEFPAAHPATPAGLDAHLAFLPRAHDLAWIVSAHRADVLALAPEVIRRGGHIALGVGDHPHVERGLPTNAELVAELAAMARALGRAVATPAEARTILGAPAPVPTR